MGRVEQRVEGLIEERWREWGRSGWVLLPLSGDRLTLSGADLRLAATALVRAHSMDCAGPRSGIYAPTSPCTCLALAERLLRAAGSTP